MAKTKNAANQQAHRDRVKAKFMAVIDDLLDDVDIYTERKDDGKMYVTWDMSQDTHDKLELVAEAKGTNLDAMLGDLVKNHLKHITKIHALKEKHESRGK